MKIHIGPYVSRWISDIHSDYMDKKYSGGLWPRYAEEAKAPIDERAIEALEDVLQWVYDYTINIYLDRKKRKINVKINDYDTWSMDSTLSYVILPMLKQLHENKHGAPFVDDEDVPEHLRSFNAPPKENYYDIDEYHFKRWDWVLEEIIWAFEQKSRDFWEEDFYEYEEDPTNTEGLGLGFKIVCSDDEGRKAHQERMSNGFRLLGKYFEALWD